MPSPNEGVNFSEWNNTIQNFRTDAMGYGSAATAVINAGFQIGSMVQQYNMAKAMLEHKERMANSDLNFQMERFGKSEKLMGEVEELNTYRNEATLANAKAHKGNEIAKARLLEAEKTEKATRVRNRTVLKGILNRRGTPFYGTPATTT